MTALTTAQQNTVLIRHSRRIVEYLQAHGIQNEVQREALLRLAETWDKLSPDGEWDEVLETKLRARQGLFDFSPAPKAEPKTKPADSAVVQSTTEIYKTSVKAINISQPDAMTCQSSCIGMATGDSNVAGIRARLDALGTAGDPAVMGIVLREKLGDDRYKYSGKASIEDMKTWLRAGELLIIHVFFTPSGHVIVLDGLKDVVGTEDFFDSKDPWSEFDGSTFSYNNPQVNFYDGYYSARLIYAGAVAAFTFDQAIAAYRQGKLDSNEGGAWVHRILPKKA